MEDLDNHGTAETFVGHTLDGQAHHGWPTNNFGLRECLGSDPAGAGDWFSLDQLGNVTTATGARFFPATLLIRTTSPPGPRSW